VVEGERSWEVIEERGVLGSKLLRPVMHHEDAGTKACRQSSYIDVSVKAMISWLMAQQRRVVSC
jgi:hypothetical protein